MIDGCFAEIEAATSTKQACALLGKSCATHYCRLQPPFDDPPAPRPAPPNKLSAAERQHVLMVLRSREYCDLAPAQVAGPERGVYYELYVIIEIFSRYVVGWTVAAAETGELAESLIRQCLTTQGVGREQLTLHADRGTSMTSKPIAQLLVDLGVARNHSRLHVSNDNPYSAANFKTMKYCPAFPARFAPSSTPATSAPTFSTTTTTVIATRASTFTPSPQCTTAPPPRSGLAGPPPSRRFTPPTPPACATATPDPRSSPTAPGTTNPHATP